MLLLNVSRLSEKPSLIFEYNRSYDFPQSAEAMVTYFERDYHFDRSLGEQLEVNPVSRC